MAELHNKHVLLITPGFPADESDSTCLPYIQTYLLAFQELHPNTRFSVITLQYPFQREPYWWHGVHVFPCGGKNRKGFRRLMVWKQAVRTAKQIYQTDPYSCVHALWLNEAWLVADRVVRGKNLTYVASALGQDVLPSNKYLNLNRKSAAQIVATTERQGLLLNESAPKLEVTANIFLGIEDSEVDPKLERTIDVLGVGGLAAVKRFHLFVEAIAKLKEENPKVRAVLVGGGALESELREQAKAAGVERNLELTGTLPRDEVKRLMWQSKVLFHPSRHESFGLVFAEALQRGMQIVSGDVGCAQPSDRWRVTSDEMLNQNLQESLSEYVNRAPINPFPVRKTVEAYYQLYFPADKS